MLVKITLIIHTNFVYLYKQSIKSIELKLMCNLVYISKLIDNRHLVQCTVHGTKYVFEDVGYEAYLESNLPDEVMNYEGMYLKFEGDYHEFLVGVN